MQNTSKSIIVRLFLEFVLKYTRKVSPILATLGGEGLEASLWSTQGIPPLNGWLIECHGLRARNLIRGYAYRHCDSLQSFPSLYRIQHGSQGIDGFHLDLCGTFEANDEVFGPIVPLIMRSEGRCFGVTVADQRRNKSTEEFLSVYQTLEEYLGKEKAETFKESLTEEHVVAFDATTTANPDLIVKREIGVAVALVKLLHEMRAYEIDRIERYQYLSDTYGGAFRMRTYFFHFSKKGSGRRKVIDPRTTLELWANSPMRKVTQDGVIDIGLSRPQPEPPATMGNKEIEMEMSAMDTPTEYEDLAKLVALSSSSCQQQFKLLLADASVAFMLRNAGLTLVTVGNEKHTPVNEEQVALVTSTEKKSSDEDDKLESLIDLLVARTEGVDSPVWEKAAKRFCKIHGFKFDSRKVGGHYARMNGSFRKAFLVRVLESNPSEEKLAAIAGAYSKLGGVSITVDDLRKEAVGT